VLCLLGWHRGGAAAYHDAARAAPQLAEAHFRRGEALLRCRRYREAGLAYREAVRLRPGDLEAHGNLVLALARGGLGGPAVLALREMIHRCPGDAELRVLQGALLRRLHRQAEAIQAFRSAATLRPRAGARRFFLGEALLGAREWRSALEAHDQAQRAEAERSRVAGRSASRRLPRTLLRRSVPRSARAPRTPLLHRQVPVGAIAREMAAPLVRLATRVAAEAHLVVAWFYLGHRPHLALRSLRQGLKLREGSRGLHPAARGLRPAARAGLTLGLLATVGLAPGARAGAEETVEARNAARQCTAAVREERVTTCRHALELGLAAPRKAIVLGVLARQLANLERWPEAVEVYRALVTESPDDADARLRLGEALLRGVGRAEEAVEVLGKAIDLGAGAPAYGALGAALNLLGRHTEALLAFQEAERLEPDFFEYRPAAREIRDASKRGERWPPDLEPPQPPR
jgi:tetratricopeptide (TPR) repeat protein